MIFPPASAVLDMMSSRARRVRVNLNFLNVASISGINQARQ